MRPASPCPSEATLRPRTLASWASFRCSICVFRLTSSGTRRVYTVARPFRSVIAHPTMPSRLPKEVAQASSGPILVTMRGHLTHGRLRAWLLGRQRTQNESAEREEVLVQQAATLCAELSDGAGPPLTCCGSSVHAHGHAASRDPLAKYQESGGTALRDLRHRHASIGRTALVVPGGNTNWDHARCEWSSHILIFIDCACARTRKHCR